MKIDRFGSSRNHGMSTITLQEPKFWWNPGAAQFEIRKEAVQDFSTDAAHDYTLSFSADEIASIFKALIVGVESVSGAKIIEAFKPQANDMHRLVATLLPPFVIQTKR